MFTNLTLNIIKMAILIIYIFNATPIASGTLNARMTRKIDWMVLNCIWKDAEQLKQF